MSKSKELRAIMRWQEDLRITIRNNLDRVAQFMEEKEIITREMWREATDTGCVQGADSRAKVLLRRWGDKVEEDPSFFAKVVEGHFRQSPEHYKSILSKLDEDNSKGSSPANRQKLDEPVAGVSKAGSAAAAASVAVAYSPSSESQVFSTEFSAGELAGWLHSHHNLPEGACKILMDQSISGSVFVDLKKEDIDSLRFNFGASKILLKVLNQIKGEQPAQGARVASRTELDSEHYSELCHQLYSVRDQWEDIALALGFKDYEIKNIKRDLSLQYTGNQLYEVISFWLRWDPEDERGSKDIATLEALQKALNQTNNAKIKLKITMNFTK